MPTYLRSVRAVLSQHAGRWSAASASKFFSGAEAWPSTKDIRFPKTVCHDNPLSVQPSICRLAATDRKEGVGLAGRLLSIRNIAVKAALRIQYLGCQKYSTPSAFMLFSLPTPRGIHILEREARGHDLPGRISVTTPVDTAVVYSRGNNSRAQITVQESFFLDFSPVVSFARAQTSANTRLADGESIYCSC